MSSAALLTAPAPILALHHRLLASASATAVLREMFGGPVEIRRVPGPAAPADAAQCALLRVAGPDEVVHRRVTLVAAGQPVSDADLWYVPARLLPGMAETLLTTTQPFGAVVAPMRPTRETIAARITGPSGAHALLHEALLHAESGIPIALVHERYRSTASPLQE